jgi:hypothetical protein
VRRNDRRRNVPDGGTVKRSELLLPVQDLHLRAVGFHHVHVEAAAARLGERALHELFAARAPKRDLHSIFLLERLGKRQ